MKIIKVEKNSTLPKNLGTLEKSRAQKTWAFLEF